MKRHKKTIFYKIIAFCIVVFSMQLQAQRHMEKLDRGLVAVKVNNGVFLSWRVFGTDPENVAFNIYRDGTKVNATPITGATNMTDAAGSTSSTYSVKAIINGTERSDGSTAQVWESQVLTLNLNRPPGGRTPAGENYTYEPNDINVGDLDGDGKYDLVVKWYPSNAKDNSQGGYTGNCILDAYKLDGTFMWRIDLGVNIRSGAHYTQHLVADFDLDGKAEVICKTAEGTKDGSGNFLHTGPAANDNDNADHRSGGDWAGFIWEGPEYLTIFNGETGNEMQTVYFQVNRLDPYSWGKSTDNYNRVERFNSTVAYLDGYKPSAVFGRGYYGRMTHSAWDWNGSTLSNRWIFNSDDPGNSGAYGQGNHSMMAADVDGDGYDEIFTGAAAIDHNGRFMWRTGYGHGDANHIGDLNPDNPGLEVFTVSEPKGSEPDHYMVDARTGNILFGQGAGNDNGRGMCGDIDAGTRGQEVWSNKVAGTRSCTGTQISANKGSCNFRVYWDGDLQDELLDGNAIDKWNGNGTTRLHTLTGNSCNGTKATPNLSADILGDWREEVILHDGGSRIYISTTTIPTTYKLYTLMHDPVYRNAISWQQSAYNQPPHLGFYLADFNNVPKPNIVVDNTDCNGDVDGTAYLDDCAVCVGGNTGLVACSSSGQAEDACSYDGTVDSDNSGYQGSGFVNLNNAQGSSIAFNILVTQAGTYTFSIRYANGGAAARPMTLTMDGVTKTINFAPTGGWASWATEEVSMNFTELVNTISLSAQNSDGGPNIDMFVFADEHISFGSCEQDCAGLYGGTAYYDNCNTCVGGTTGLEPCEQDCNGDWGGSATFDNCDICSGGNTGKTPCMGAIQGEDFCSANGIKESTNTGYIGSGYVNLDNANGSSVTWYLNSDAQKTASIDIRYANGGTTGRGMNVLVNNVVQASIAGNVTGDWTTWSTETVSLQLFAGVNTITMTATTGDGGPNIDILLFNTDGLTAGGCDADCNGVVGGSAYYDNCNVCVGGNTGKTSCTQDCNGDWGGSAYIDNCDDCVGGNTGLDACAPIQIHLKTGWNLLGCPFSGTTPIPEALASIFDYVEVVKDLSGFYMKEQDEFLNSLKTMDWGKGYLIKVSQDCDIMWNH